MTISDYGFDSVNFKKAVDYQKKAKKDLRFLKIRKIAKRFVASLAIPFFISLVIAFCVTFFVKTSDAANSAFFFKNLLYFFSKVFFASIPLMMWFIFKD